MRQSSAPVVSRQPVSMDMLYGAKTVMSRLEKVTVQSASQIGPMPINVCLDVSIMWPVVGNSWTSWGMVDLAVPAERVTWLFAVTICTFGAIVLVFVGWASGV